MAIFEKIFGDASGRVVKDAAAPVAAVNAIEPEFQKLSDAQLLEKTAEFRSRLGKGESLDQLLPEAFAAVREAARRSLGQRHFDVQLMGGLALHRGMIAEMKTGEGKTLVATLPVYLNALEGKGVHVVTVNDYLSRRDAVWMGEVYHKLGLSVGVIAHEGSYLFDPSHEVPPDEGEVGSFKVRQQFLRPVSRRECYRADITYGTNNEFGFDYLRDHLVYQKEQMVGRMPSEGGRRYAIVDEVDSILIDEARTPLIIAGPSEGKADLYVTFAAIAEKLQRGEDFEVDEKRKQIMLSDAGIEKAEKLLGMGDIYTEAGVRAVHHLETAVRAKALFMRDKEYVVKNGEVIIVDEFTGRLQPGRRWSEGLHQAIEAKEGVPIKQETRTFASITFQNYFRLYDKLSGMTGTALTSSEEFFKVYGIESVAIPTHRAIARVDHNDLIFQTEIGKYRAISKEVAELHKKGQPVLIGTASIEKNEALSAVLRAVGIPHEVLNAKNHEREGEIIANAGEKGAVTIATNMAGRGVDIRLGGALSDEAKQTEVKTLGGLYVLGTERHEARRIDNQLRGRSGRQGDSGETRFFVSLEDSLMRIFAGDTIKSMMGKLGLEEDQPIENRLITRSLENAQQKIEDHNFDIRKHVLEYDDVLNLQRSAIYGRRERVLLASHEEILAELQSIIGDDQPFADIIAKKKEEIGEAQFAEALRRLFLQTLDTFWMDHLEIMDHLRDSVNLRAYGQRDPLVEYKREGLRLFKDLQQGVNQTVLSMVAALAPQAFVAEEKKMEQAVRQATLVSGADAANPSSSNGGGRPASAKAPAGRNDPCPCGSGKKYKVCGLKNTEEHQKLMAGK